MSLTKGAAKIAISLSSGAEDRTFQPVFQVISISEVSNLMQRERFRLVLSDGQNLVPAMISTQLNHLVTTGEIEEDTLIIVNDFMNTAVQGHNVLILLEAQVWRKTAKRIGKPTEIIDTTVPQGSSTVVVTSNINGGGSQQQQQQQKEITRYEALQILLTDESLSDIKLISEIDSTEVLAHRNMLGARSKIFRDMLYGELSSATTLELPYPGATLKAVVSYMYTNQIPDPTNFDSPSKFVSLVVSVIDAASFCGLPTFINKCEQLAKTEIDRNPEIYALRFLAMCGRFPSLRSSSISKMAIQQICRQPSKLLLENSNDSLIPMLSYTQVKYLVWNPDILSDEYTLLKVIESWANVTKDKFSIDYEIHNLEEDKIASIDQDDDGIGVIVNSSDTSNNDNGGDFVSNRQEAARNLTKYINLSSIPPSKLVEVAATSNDLISQEQLFTAFKTQAFVAEKKNSIGNFLKGQPRHPVWESSNSLLLSAPKTREYYTLELLKCKLPLTNGVHKWSILMQETSEWICVGVASTSHELIHDTLLGAQAGGWALSVDGTVTHNNSHEEATGLTFKKNSIVTFILDLTGSGTLSGIVDDKLPATLLFQNMFNSFDHETTVTASAKKKNKKGSGKKGKGSIGSGDTAPTKPRITAGFVPAVELYPSDKVQFLGFDRNIDDEDEEEQEEEEDDRYDDTTTNHDDEGVAAEVVAAEVVEGEGGEEVDNN